MNNDERNKRNGFLGAIVFAVLSWGAIGVAYWWFST